MARAPVREVFLAARRLNRIAPPAGVSPEGELVALLARDRHGCYAGPTRLIERRLKAQPEPQKG